VTELGTWYAPDDVGERTVIYLRVSKGERHTENQRPDVERVIATRRLELVGEYEEKASAAKTRPVFDKMIRDAHRGAFDVLVVWSLDRFGRSMVGNLQAVLDLDRSGVQVVSVRETWLDTGSAVRPLLASKRAKRYHPRSSVPPTSLWARPSPRRCTLPEFQSIVSYSNTHPRTRPVRRLRWAGSLAPAGHSVPVGWHRVRLERRRPSPGDRRRLIRQAHAPQDAPRDLWLRHHLLEPQSSSASTLQSINVVGAFLILHLTQGT
jgi:hypothetical protein